jgi:MFS family permease
MVEESKYPGTRWLVLLAYALGGILMEICMLSISPLFPQIAQNLKVDPGTVAGLMASFLMTGTIVMLVAGGPLCDRLGPLWTLALSAFFFTLPMSLAPWFCTTYHRALLARAFAGVGTAFLIPPLTGILAIWFPPRQRGMASGISGVSMSVGIALAMLLGPALFNVTHSWQKMWALLSIIGWIAFIYCVVMAFALKAPSTGESAGGAGDGGAFRKALAKPATYLGIVLTFAVQWCFISLMGLVPGYLAADKPLGVGYGPMRAGQLMQGLTMLGGIVGPMLGAILVDKIFHGKVKPVIVIGCAVVCVTSLALVVPVVVASVWITEAVLILAGLGIMASFTVLYIVIAKNYPPQIVGKITALWLGLGSFGSVFGAQVGGMLVTKTGSYKMTMTATAVAAVVAVVVMFMISEGRGGEATLVGVDQAVSSTAG